MTGQCSSGLEEAQDALNADPGGRDLVNLAKYRIGQLAESLRQ